MAGSNGDQAERYNDFDANYAFFSGTCSPYQDTYLSITVLDADDRYVSATRESFCPR